MRRLALPRAVVRSSKLGCAAESGATLSMSCTRTPVPDRPRARLAPTSPPPTIATSNSRSAAREDAAAGLGGSRMGCRALRHQSLDRRDVLRCAIRQHLDARLGDHDVVLDAYTNALEALGD